MSDASTLDDRIFTDVLTVLSCEKCGCQIDITGLDPFTEVECPDCAHEQTIPARLAQFLLLKLIGTGGMGGVYLARDETLGRNVAIKIMRRSLGEDAEFVSNFKREAQSAAKLNHPNIAQIYSFGQEKGQPYIVMELVSGIHLDKLIEQHGGLDPIDVLKVIIDIAEGLRAADEAGLVHGDIKPENILLDSKDNAKLVDFGLASSSRKAPENGGIWGTPYYIAPEKVRRKPADARSDIYSLGATLFHVLAGRPPFDGETPVDVVRARLNAPAPRLNEVCPTIDERIADIVARMLEAEPAQRYPTYASLLSDLRKVYSSMAPHGVRGRRLFAGLRSVSGPISEVVPASPGGRRNKVVVRKGLVAAIGSETQRTARTTTKIETPKKPRKPVKWVKPTLLALLGLLALGGIGFGWHSFASARSQRRAAVEAERKITEARKAVQERYPLAIEARTAIAAAVSETEPWVETIKEAYQSVEGQPLVVPSLGPVPVEPVPAEPAEKAPSPDAVAEQSPAPEPVQQAMGVTRREVLAGDMPAIRRLALEAVYDLVEMQGLLVQANQSVMVSSNSLQHAESATNLEAIESARSNLDLELDQLNTLQTKASELRDRIAKSRENVIALRTAFQLNEQKRRDDEARLAEQKRMEEAEAQRTADLLRKTEREIDMADRLYEEAKGMVATNAFREGLTLLQRSEGSLETDAGKERLAAYVLRFENLVALQTFAVEQLNRTPYSRGWIKQQPALDIVGAERLGIRVRATQDTHRLVRWEEVSSFQFYRIVEFCLKEYRESNERDLAALAARKLAFAVYCAMLAPSYPDTDLGKTALSLAEQAVRMRPSLKEDRDKLIPDTLK